MRQLSGLPLDLNENEQPVNINDKEKLHYNMSSGRCAGVRRLADRVLWGDQPPATAGKALQVYVSELRKLVEADAHARR